VRSAVRVATATGALVLAGALLQCIRNSDAANLLVLAAWVAGGFMAGARARRPVHQAATAGALAYLGSLVCLIWRGQGNPSSLPETPCVPVCNVLMLALLAAFGGWISAAVLPCEPSHAGLCAPLCACRECGYNLTGNVSGRCPECGTPIQTPTSETHHEA